MSEFIQNVTLENLEATLSAYMNTYTHIHCTQDAMSSLTQVYTEQFSKTMNIKMQANKYAMFGSSILVCLKHF